MDLRPLVPEAREPARQAAEAYLKHTRPWFVGLLVHGSALKGGVIPGCSDIDFRLYLDAAAFEAPGLLPLDLSLAIHRDLATIDPAPFAYVQCYAAPVPAPADDPAGMVIPGTYHMLAGELPVPEATPEQVLDQARQRLAALQTDRLRPADRLLDHGDGRLERVARLICTDVWPALYHVLTCRADDPVAVWALPKDQAIALLPDGEPLGEAVREFHRAVLAYYPERRSAEDALRVIERGQAFLHLARDWYQGSRG